MESIFTFFDETFKAVQLELQEIEKHPVSRMIRSSESLAVVIPALQKLNGVLANYSFALDKDEIYFFKYLKPHLLAFEKYHRHRLAVETLLLNGPEELNKQELEKLIKPPLTEKEQSQMVYYKINDGSFDTLFFVRTNGVSLLPFAEPDVNMEWGVTTYYCEKYAWFMAREMLEEDILKNDKPAFRAPAGPTLHMAWVGTLADFIEFLKAVSIILEEKNDARAIHDFQKIFCLMFGMDYNNIQTKWNNIRKRKKDKLLFLPVMMQRIVNAINAENGD